MKFGNADASFQAAGGEEGIKKLVNDFYDLMSTDPRFKTIYEMHPADNTLSRDKLFRFLCGWMGGPRLYHEKYGSISIPGVHRHLSVGYAERDQWIACMQDAVDQQPYEAVFKGYLIEQLKAPAEMIRRGCEDVTRL